MSHYDPDKGAVLPLWTVWARAGALHSYAATGGIAPEAAVGCGLSAGTGGGLSIPLNRV